ncbi:MAG: nucleoside diphosphate kinase [Bacteroidetes bacterium]|nr:nucleoside diphosphate kinase [Bacteroidota bacterium]
MSKEIIEQTLVLIKPDALRNSLTGYVLSLLSEFHTGLLFAGAKIVHVNRMLAEEHYAEHRGKVFYPSLIDYIMGCLHYPDEPHKRRVIAFVYQGSDATKKMRDICGPTNPHTARETRPGCIRALGTIVPLKDADGNIIGDRMDNLIHASASDSDAEREIKLWFRPIDIPPSMRAYPTEINEEHYYFKNNRLYMTHEPGSACLLAPGDIVWKTDLDAIRMLYQGVPAPYALEAVAAKYLINVKQEHH